MIPWRATYEMAKADLLDRMRGSRFLIILGVVIYGGYALVPPLGAGYITMAFGPYRGLYSSAYLGTMMALITAVILSLLGFYIIKGSLERDRNLGIGQIWAVSPAGSFSYLLAKAAGNVFVLVTMTGAVLVAGIGMQLLRGEYLRLDLLAYAEPFVWITIPAIIAVSVVAVWFDIVPQLRGALGHAVYFFVWAGLVGTAIMATTRVPGPPPAIDATGFAAVLPSLVETCRQVFPACSPDQFIVGISPVPEGTAVQTFFWPGIRWTGDVIGPRIMWAILPIVSLILAVPLFHRFDPARTPGRTGRGGPFLRRGLARAERDGGLKADHSEDQPAGHPLHPGAWRKEVPRASRAAARVFPAGHKPPGSHGALEAPAMPPARLEADFSTGATEGLRRWFSLISAELKVMGKSVQGWWYLGTIALAAAGAVVSPYTARAWILPLIFIWPVPLWASMGCREKVHNTFPVIFTAPDSLLRQFSAQWFSGVVVAASMAAGVMVRAVLAGDWIAAGAHAIAAVFVPTLALALGTWSGGPRMFEVLYLIFWYVSLQPGIPPALDFMVRHGGPSYGAPTVYLSLTVLLLILAVIGRRRLAPQGGRR